MTSISSEFRSAGNAIFLALVQNEENLPGIIVESKLQECLKNYFKAFNTSNNDIERSSACKNIFSTTFRMYKLYAGKRYDKKLYNFNMQECMKHANTAINYGCKSQSKEWLSKIESTAQEAFEAYVECLEKDAHYVDRMELLIKLLNVSPDHIKCLINYNLCELSLDLSQIASHASACQVRACLNTNRNCDYYIEECQRLLKNVHISLELDVKLNSLQEKVLDQRCLLEGLNSMNIGTELLAKCTLDEEVVDFDRVIEVVDWLRDSLLKFRDKHLVNEAEVVSYLGHVYNCYLKQTHRAKQYYQQCIHIVDSLDCKELFALKLKWFQRCLQALQKYSVDELEKEKQQNEREREKVLPKIKDDLDKIREKNEKGSHDFLQFIYEAYPPKNLKLKLQKPVTSDNLKKTLQKAITHYHPDKNKIETYGAEWHFIVEEITKNLTRFYERMKSVD